MTVQEIVTRVRSAIDELMANDSQFINQSTDEANLTNVIKDKIGYALQHIMEVAPIEKLDSSVFEVYDSTALASNFSINATTLVGTLKLPSDLLRIIEARLSSWSHFPIPETDKSQVYLMQQDTYARGSWDRPVNILTYGSGTTRVLEMYCAKTASDTLKFVFIRKPTKKTTTGQDPQEYYDVPPALEASLIYQIAGLTMLAFREDVAASLFAIADRYLDPEQVKGEKE